MVVDVGGRRLAAFLVAPNRRTLTPTGSRGATAAGTADRRRPTSTTTTTERRQLARCLTSGLPERRRLLRRPHPDALRRAAADGADRPPRPHWTLTVDAGQSRDRHRPPGEPRPVRPRPARRAAVAGGPRPLGRNPVPQVTHTITCPTIDRGTDSRPQVSRRVEEKRHGHRPPMDASSRRSCYACPPLISSPSCFSLPPATRSRRCVGGRCCREPTAQSGRVAAGRRCCRGRPAWAAPSPHLLPW